MAICGDSSTAAIVPFLLTEDNYEDWRIYMKSYLLAQDLWGIIEYGDDVDLCSSSNDVGNWRKKNAAALHAIYTTSSPHIFAKIKYIETVKDAWDLLANMHQQWLDEGKEDEIIETTHHEELGGEKEDEMTEDSQLVQVKKSICRGDWNSVKQFFVIDRHPLDTRIVSDRGYTAFRVAVSAGQDNIAEELLKMMSATDLEEKTATHGHTALSSVTISGGRTDMAKCIVQKNKKLLTIENNQGRIPVSIACAAHHTDITRYLYAVTPPEVLSPEHGNHGFDLMRWAIDNKMLDICLHLLQRNPKLAVTTNEKRQGTSPILKLSRQPSAFTSAVRRGCRLSFWQIWIYHWLKVELPMTSSDEVQIPVTDDQDLKAKNIRIPGIKQIYDLKLTHLYAVEILRCMCEHVSTLKVRALINFRVYDAMVEVTKHGIVEFVMELLRVTQPIIYRKRGDKRDVFMIAIQYRQENIFNLLYGIHEAWQTRIVNRTDAKGNSMLHLAGEIAPDFQLTRISGPALQMQRELQWFKEVETIVPEWCKEFKNKNGETPNDVFSNSHKELVKEGEKWMKDTAGSFIIVGTLIVTILFAAAFTLPGGNDQGTGFPIFLRKRSFMIFIISDAVSFFAASTSVLMFLGILTSRFAQEDFLESLPRKLIMGLSTLFVSIAAMTVSFSATLLIILQDRWWAIIPIIMMGSIPVVLFVSLQFPLLCEIFVSTYAPRIFNREMKPWL